LTKQGKLREALLREAPAIMAKLVALAKLGDVAAAKEVLSRCLPPLRAVDLPITLPLGQDLATAAEAVQGALGAGAITPDQGQALAGILASLGRVRETAELTRRIEALESRPQQGSLDLPDPEPKP
jgi:hypothetical protein